MSFKYTIKVVYKFTTYFDASYSFKGRCTDGWAIEEARIGKEKNE